MKKDKQRKLGDVLRMGKRTFILTGTRRHIINGICVRQTIWTPVPKGMKVSDFGSKFIGAFVSTLFSTEQP